MRLRKARKSAENLSRRWLTDPKAKQEVAELLSRFNLDDYAVEAKAMRSLELESYERMLTWLEPRRNKVLVSIAHYRAAVAAQSVQKAELAPGVVPVRRLGRPSNQNSAD
jgi:hypothetical protein